MQATTITAAAVSSALVPPMAAQAVEFSVSGHVNRVIISVDGGGNDGDLPQVDANSSQARFRFTGSEELDSELTAGIQLEYGLTGNVRHANVSLASGGGKLTIGHGSRATDGMDHADLGGVSWLSGATNWCSYATTGPACPSNDGGRAPMLRCDTPTIGPTSIAVSTTEGDYWDARLSVAGSMGDAEYGVRIGHIGENDVGSDAMTASAGVGHGTSVAVDGSYVKLDYFYGDGNDNLQIGHIPPCCWPWCPPPCRRCPRGIGFEHEQGAGATSIDTIIDVYEESLWRGYEDSSPNVYPLSPHISPRG